MSLPHLYKVSSTQWACSPSKEDKHILRCIFGDDAEQAFNSFSTRQVQDEIYKNNRSRLSDTLTKHMK